MMIEGKSPFEMRRVTALIGPYGSGKTELAIGLSLHAAAGARDGGPFRHAFLGDLDVLKPYFRSREAGEPLKKAGVELLAPKGALSNSDLPIITPELRGTVGRADAQLVLDVGGDPVGARALGSLSDVVGAADYDLLLVLNRYRPFSESLEGVVAQAHQISGAAQLRITGIVSNTHMMEETTADDVRWGLELSEQAARALDVPLRLLALPQHLLPDFAGQPGLPPIVGIQRRMMPSFLGGVVLASRSTHPLTRSDA